MDTLHSKQDFEVRGLPKLAAVDPIPRPKKRDIHFWDRLFSRSLKAISLTLPAGLIFVGFYLFQAASPSIEKFVWNFLESHVWDPVNEIFGATPVIFGTIVSSLIAVIIAAPLSIGVAFFIK
jgi:ABC-type phosphate transport system permease subunit